MNYAYKVSISYFNIPDFSFLKNVDPVELFLSSDIQATPEFAFSYIESIEKVQNGEVKGAELTGNCCVLFVEKETTKVVDMFADEGMIKEVTVSTEWLKKIILLWIKEQDKFSTIKKCKEWRSIDPDYTIYCFLASVFHVEIVDFDQSLNDYLVSESDNSRTMLAKAMEFFLQANYPDADKAAYIKHCADGVAFDSVSNEPLNWLRDLAKKIEKNLN